MEVRLEIDRVFSSHMVLQREKTIKLWGKCSGKNSVTVTFMGKTVTADIKRNRWVAVLPPMEIARNQRIVVQSGEEVISLYDICIGEVWLAGGQSNMEFYMKYDADYEKNIGECENSDIRFYDVPKVCYEGQEDDFDYSQMGVWRTCKPDNLDYYSAVGYYFAKKLWKELQMPVGIIGCNKAGSCVHTWMSMNILKKHGQVWIEDFEEQIKDIDYRAYQDTMKTDRRMNMGDPFNDAYMEEILYGASIQRQRELIEKMAEQENESNNSSIRYDNRPTCYYDNMLVKIAGVGIRGVLWYQGESEVLHPECYCDIFQDMIQCWRDLWEEQLPFYCVQLAPFQSWMNDYGIDFPFIRRSQEKAVQNIEKAYLISSSDVGMRYDIHPKNKQPIGYRLALSALKHEYAKAIHADAPKGIAAKKVGNDIYIYFSGDFGTLKVCGEGIREMQLFARGLKWREGKNVVEKKEQEVTFDVKDFSIEGKNLILHNANIRGRRMYRVAFAQKDYYEVNLYGDNGIPAMPFECIIQPENDID